MRVRSFVLGAVVLAAILGVYVVRVRWLGFPDGALTELDRAERVMFRVGAALGGILAFAAFVLAAQRSPHRSAFRVLLGSALALIVCAAALDVVFRLVLDHGQGG